MTPRVRPKQIQVRAAGAMESVTLPPRVSKKLMHLWPIGDASIYYLMM